MSNHDTDKFETPPPPPPPTEPPPPPPVVEERPKRTWRDRRVGVVALAASTVAALVIGGTVGAVSGAAVGYGVGHHDHPDRPALVQRQDQPQGSMPGQQFVPPNGQLPPGLTQEDEESSGSQS
jgi:hypothetical protein